MHAKEKKKNHQQNTETGYYVHFQPELCEVFFKMDFKKELLKKLLPKMLM